MSNIVLNVPTPPWQPSRPSNPEYGSTRDLEAKAAARYEASRAAYEAKHPELYTEWVAKLTEHRAACKAIFNAPNAAAAKSAAAAATNVLSPILAERIKGADKKVITDARRTATIAKTADEEAKRVAEYAMDGDENAKKHAADAAKRAADANVRAIDAAKRAMLLFEQKRAESIC